jgi:iron complex outermembrane receptor protein
MVNVPLVEDRLGLRVVGFYRHEDGWVDNIESGVSNSNVLKDYGGRAMLLAKPTDRLSIRLLASFEKNSPSDSALTNPRYGTYKRRSVRGDVFGGKVKTFNATVEYQFNGARLTSSSTYSHYDQAFIADISNALGHAAPYALDAEGPQKTFVEEARLVSDPGGKIDWTVGVFYLNRVNRLTNALLSTRSYLAGAGITGGQGPNGDLIGSTSLRDLRHEIAGFGEVTYHINDRLFATAGLRYGRTDEQLFTEAGFNTNYVTAALTGRRGQLAVVPVAASAQPEVSGNRPSFKGSVSYRVSNEATAYALVSTGYRAPVQNANAGRASLIDPTDFAIPNGAGSDKLINYETGLKGRFLDGRLTANLALYWIVWSDIQVQANRVSDSAQFATNIGQARSRGAEFEVVAHPVPPLSFGMNGSIGGTRITSLSSLEAAISGARYGDRLSAPNFQGSMFGQVDFNLWSGVTGYFNATFQHVGSFPNMFPNVPGRPSAVAPTYGYTDDYENINFSLGLKKGDVSAIFYVENVLDDHSITYLHPETYLDSRVGRLQPRTVGLRLGYRL